MTYTELFEHIYGGDYDSIDARVAALEPVTRKAWDIIRMFSGRKGFEYWWNPNAAGGMPAECNDEIFEKLKQIIES